MTAYALGVPATLFHLYANVDWARATSAQRAGIAVAGPLVGLLIGVACWAACRKSRNTAGELFLLYLATFGLSTFFGNLLSTAFVGDFSRVAEVFRVPIGIRFAATGAGADRRPGGGGGRQGDGRRRPVSVVGWSPNPD